ncbi:BMP family ABC transporter substrate-binding protein [Leptotrichia sp. OH3620_COT-345]|uniref:BMP family lipoprotein n=1 Tax=Leptotrichia sp. OH3620_COT-345 TaxID=2491048 RepID=UPI000F64C8C4|nr:BMP family ABC transporter substrate-binding protein [Leptotrichia sp. OH3620_COT-345]RRD39004.1 BMP family ABC transporter substrate-binding protein [Leptotrichia sp. OH3620_COT-345]
MSKKEIMKNKMLVIILIFLSIVTFGTTETDAKLKVAVIYSVRGKGDKSYNDFAYEGLMKSKKDFGIEFKEFIQKISILDIEDQLRAMAKSKKYDLIIGIPKAIKLGIEKIAKEYPEQKFVVAYEAPEISLSNVATILFKEEEGGFLAGILAGMMTKSYSVGFMGSTETENVKRYEKGFRQGVKYVNKNTIIFSSYVDGENPYFDIPLAKKKTENMIKKNRIGVIFHSAGGSGIGVLNAAQENGIFAIASEQNEDKLAPGTVLTSVMTDLSIPLYYIIKNTVKGKFKGEEYYFGLSDNAIKVTDFKYTVNIIGKEKLNKFQEIREMIRAGKIKVQY